MLVLTRKPGQSIMIGDGVEVQVLSVAGEKVRLGITAPREVPIFRNEVYERIEDEAEAASQDGRAQDGRVEVEVEVEPRPSSSTRPASRTSPRRRSRP